MRLTYQIGLHGESSAKVACNRAISRAREEFELPKGHKIKVTAIVQKSLVDFTVTLDVADER